MSRATLGRWAATVVYYAFMFPFYWVVFAAKRAFYATKLRAATKEAHRLHKEDGRKRFIVPVGRELHVMDRTQLKRIVNQYRQRHGGKFVSWNRFYIATVG